MQMKPDQFKRVSALLAGRDSDLARLAWVARSLSELPAGWRLLDAGAGEQRLRQYCSHLQYVSQDFCQYEPSRDDQLLRVGKWDTSRIDIASDITSIPVPADSFDAVLCSEVLEHVPDPLAAVREFARVLKPGGTLILTVPFCSLTHMAPYHHASGLNRYWYEHHLPRMSLEIEEMTPNGNWFDYVGQELRRARYVSRTYASGLLGWLLLLVSFPLRAALGLQSRMDRGSNQLLCFGYFVRARKASTRGSVTVYASLGSAHDPSPP